MSNAIPSPIKPNAGLSIEVWTMILEELGKTSFSTLRELTCLSRTYHEIIIPILYRSFHLTPSFLDAERPYEILPKLLAHTKAFKFSSNLRIAPESDAIAELIPLCPKLEKLSWKLSPQWVRYIRADVDVFRAIERAPPSVLLDLEAHSRLPADCNLIISSIDAKRLSSFSISLSGFDWMYTNTTNMLSDLMAFISGALNLEILSLAYQNQSEEPIISYWNLPVSSELDPSVRMRFPPIKTLKLQNYSWPDSTDSFDTWDLTKLEELSLQGDYHAFFKHVPDTVLDRLRSLHLDSNMLSDENIPLHIQDQFPIDRNLMDQVWGKLTELDSLKLGKSWKNIWPLNFKNIPSLKHFYLAEHREKKWINPVEYSGWERTCITFSGMKNLQLEQPELETLAFAVDIHHLINILPIITEFTHLRNLHLYATPRSDFHRRGISTTTLTKTCQHVFRYLSANRSKNTPPLKEVTIYWPGLEASEYILHSFDGRNWGMGKFSYDQELRKGLDLQCDIETFIDPADIHQVILSSTGFQQATKNDVSITKVGHNIEVFLDRRWEGDNQRYGVASITFLSRDGGAP